MEKRRLTSLRSVLLQYLVRTALACLLVAVGWLLVLLVWIQNSGLFLPANQAAQACQKAAQDVLPGMTAAAQAVARKELASAVRTRYCSSTLRREISLRFSIGIPRPIRY